MALWERYHYMAVPGVEAGQRLAGIVYLLSHKSMEQEMSV